MAELGISFGFDIYDGITTYLDAVKCRSEELASVRQKNKALKDLLTGINYSLSRVRTQPVFSTAAVTECLVSFEAELKALGDLVAKLAGRDATEPKWAEKMKQQAKKLSYAFDRQKLQQLEVRLDQTTSALHLAIQNLDLDVALSALDKLADLKASSNRIDVDILNIESKVSALRPPISEVSDKLPEIEASIEVVGQSLVREHGFLSKQLLEGKALWYENLREAHTIRESAARIELQLEAFSQFRDQIAAQQRHLEEMECLFTELCTGRSQPIGKRKTGKQKKLPPDLLLRRLVAKPSNLKTICDNMTSSCVNPNDKVLLETPDGNDEPHVTSAISSLLPRNLVCTCRQAGGLRPQFRTKSMNWGGFYFYQTTRMQNHLPECPHYLAAAEQRQRIMGIRLNNLFNLLGAAIDLSFCVRSGAGGWGISPSLTYHRIVDCDNAPAFRIVHLLDSAVFSKAKRRLRTLPPGTLDMFAMSALARVISLYQAKAPEASPLDCNTRNESLINCYCAFFSRFTECLSRSTCLAWLKTLIDWGVPASLHNVYNMHVIQDLISRCTRLHSATLEAVDIILGSRGDHLISRREYLSCATHEFDYISRIMELAAKSTLLAEAYEFGPLSVAILANNHGRVEYLLKHHPAMLKEQNWLGMTPLHMAADKPIYLKLLLAKANPTLINTADCCGDTPLVWAMRLSRKHCRAGLEGGECRRCSCAECVVMLLKADCAILNKEDGLMRMLVTSSERCKTRFIRHLKDRRERLKKLAMDHLSFLESTRLGLDNSTVLDAHAGVVSELLRSRSVDVPLALNIGDCAPLIYASRYFRVRDADRLFKLGFHDIDVFRQLPQSFILNGFSTDMCMWVFDHGLDVSRTVFKAPTALNAQLFHTMSAGHIAFMNLPDTLSEDSFNLTGSTEALFHKILPVALTDNCRCRCSSGGCSPFTYLLKSMTYHFFCLLKLVICDSCFDETQGVIPNCLHVLRRLSLGTALRVEDHIAAMRFLTFEMLEMEHTCCQKRYSGVYDFRSESYGIFEDETVVQLFDTLLEEFEEELHARAANISSQPNGFVEFWDNYWHKRISIEIEKFNNTSNSESNLRRAEELGVVWEKKEARVSGCKMKPNPDKNPYKKNQIEYWYYELDKIAPE